MAKIRRDDSIKEVLDYLAEGCPLNKSAGKSAMSKLIRTHFGVNAYTKLEKTKEEYRENGSSLILSWEKAVLDVLGDMPGAPKKIAAWLKGNVTIGGLSGTQYQVSTPAKTDTGKTKKVKKKEKAEKPDEHTLFMQILKTVSAKGGKRPPMQNVVTWVSGHLRHELEDIEVGSIPGPEALNLWLWARNNETEYRRTYDSKRVPAKGFASDMETGLVDDGMEIGKLLEGIRQGVVNTRKENDEKKSKKVQRMQKGQKTELQHPDGISNLPALLEQVAR